MTRFFHLSENSKIPKSGTPNSDVIYKFISMLDSQEDKLHNGVPEECHSTDHQLTTLLDSIYQTNKTS